MPATSQNLSDIECGATYTRTFTILDSSTGLPFDLTNKVPRAQLRSAIDSNDPPAAAVLSLVPSGTPPLAANETGIEVVSPATGGQIKLIISDDDTDDLQVNGTVSGKWDLEIEDSGTGVVDRLLEGDWTADPGVTRS